MEIIPLQAVPSQTVTVVLAGQTCQINVYQLSTGLFLDLYVSNAPIIKGVLCENLNRTVFNTYLGFAGDLMFIDNEGSTDPYYTGLGQVGSRYSLAYLSVADLNGQG